VSPDSPTGPALKARRHALRLSANYIAQHAGVTRESVYLAESQHRTPPTRSKALQRILTVIEAHEQVLRADQHGPVLEAPAR
jgi:predicted transcriptional regulator